MNTGRLRNFIFIIFILAVKPGFSQQSDFSISFVDSLGHTIRTTGDSEFIAAKTIMRLNFTRRNSDEKAYEIYVLQFDETEKDISIIYPANKTKSVIEKIDTVASKDLLEFTITTPSHFKLAVIAGNPNKKFKDYVEALADTSYKRYEWIRAARDSIFQSFMKLLRSDVNALPSAKSLQEIIEAKHDNLELIESDLSLAENSSYHGLSLIKFIEINLKQKGDHLVASYKVYEPQPSTLLLKWSQPSSSLIAPAEKTPFDYMIAEAAEKHLKLMNTRGIQASIVDGLRFSLKEIVATLQQWPGKVGLLLYSFDSSGFHILYADNEKKIDTFNSSIKKERLFSLSSSLQQLLLPGSSARGIRPTALKRSGSVDSLVAVISDLLLPQKFNLSSLDHLVIIPTYNIAAFPFAMLRVKDSICVIDKMSYSIVPSVNEFVITGQIRSKHFDDLDRSKFRIEKNLVYWSYERPFLFVGAPHSISTKQYQFDPLPGAKNELTALSRKVPGSTVLMEKNAVKSKVIKALPLADIIYFATHAIASAADPLNKSFILLSGKGDTSFLTAKEIQALDLQASLVVLSACETGLGKSHEGGMIGLSRAFEIAGAKNVLMSLWPISDNKTPKLMEYFFDALENKGEGHVLFPHEAFRQAILKFKKENKDPVHWGAFSIFGVPL